MNVEGHDAPHPPADAAPRRVLPPFALLWRGLALIALAAAAFLGAGEAARRSWLLLPVASALGLAGFLAAWAGLIEVTGGEKFDDHPWV